MIYLPSFVIRLAVAATVVPVTTATMVTSSAPEAPSKEDTQKEVKEEAVGDVEKAVEAPAEVVTITQTVATLDDKEREKLAAEIARLKEELESSKENASRSIEEVDRGYREKILKLEEESSLLGKEKARYEQQATDTRQVMLSSYLARFAFAN